MGKGRSRRKAAPPYLFCSGGVSPSVAFEAQKNMRRSEAAATGERRICDGWKPPLQGQDRMTGGKTLAVFRTLPMMPFT